MDSKEACGEDTGAATRVLRPVLVRATLGGNDGGDGGGDDGRDHVGVCCECDHASLAMTTRERQREARQERCKLRTALPR